MASTSIWVLSIGLALLSIAQAQPCRTICDDQSPELTEYVERSLERGKRWLHRQQLESENFNRDTLQGLFALQLSDPEFYGELPDEKRQVLRSLQEHAVMTNLALARRTGERGRNSVPYFDPLLFAQQLLTMEATCIDTTEFYGQDLQEYLTTITKEFPEPNFDNLFQFAFSLLPICTSGSELYEKAWLKLLSVRDEERPCAVVSLEEFDGKRQQFAAHTVATLSMLVMTLKCAKDQIPEDYQEVYHKRVYDYSSCIADYQNETNYGFGGNVQATAIAVQALVAAGYDQDGWNCNGAVHHLLRTQQLDGSFGKGTIDEASLVLTALAARHLGGLAEAVDCRDGGRRRPPMLQPISGVDQKVTFTLKTINYYDGSNSEYKVAIVQGETLLEALTRAKMDPENDFCFTAARFEFLGEEGVFLTSVNEVENSRETYFHWLVKKLNSDGEVEDLGIIALNDLEPENGDVIKLAFVDITPPDLRPTELPPPIEEDDWAFDLEINIKNNLTGESEAIEVRVLRGESLLEALYRAWKDPETNFTFAAAPFIFFNKAGFYPTSVNGVSVDKENNYFWLIHAGREPMGGGPMGGGPMGGGPMGGGPMGGGMMGGVMMGVGMMGGMMMDGGPMDGGPMDGGPMDRGPMVQLTPQPTSLEQLRPRPGASVELIYVDLTPYERLLYPSGTKRRELVKDIAEGDSLVNFTLIIYDSTTDMKQVYNVTIKDGEDLHDAFLRLWKDPEVDFIFGATTYEFLGRYGLFITGINGVYNDPREHNFWVIRREGLPPSIPLGLTEFVPEDFSEVHVVYVDFEALREDGDEEEEEEEDEDEERGREDRDVDLSEYDLPRDIEYCDTTANVTIYVVNNITQEHDGFNVTIIEGENLLVALLRAYKDPEIDFTFSANVEQFIFKYGVFLSSINGLANDPSTLKHWLVKRVFEEEPRHVTDPQGLVETTPSDGSEIVLVYADLSPYREAVEESKAELPPAVIEDQAIQFTLYIVNDRNGEYSGFNITTTEGENLLHALKRAWKDPETDFTFAAAPFNFFDKNGVFLSSVNGVINSEGDNFHWLVKLDDSLEKDDLVDYQPLALNEVKPADQSVVRLVFFDISDIIKAKIERYYAPGLPRDITEEDEVLTLTLYVLNNVTGSSWEYQVETIEGEELLHALARAWKDPDTDFTFSAIPFVMFNKLGYYPISVQGIPNDPEQVYYWLVHYAPLCPMEEEKEERGPFVPIDLIEYKTHRGYAAKLIYVDLSDGKLGQVSASGQGRRELPRDIVEADLTVEFTLVVIDKVNNKEKTYDVTILEGESLNEGFVRLWKDNETDFQYGAAPQRARGRFGIFPTSINGVYSDPRNGRVWIVPQKGDEEEEDSDDDEEDSDDDDEEEDSDDDEEDSDDDDDRDRIAILALNEVVPKDEDVVYVVYDDFSRDEGDRREEEEEDEEERDRTEHDAPREILGCDDTADITVYIVNNVTGEHDGFNLTIIEGENLLNTFARAWKDPEINFNFAATLFTLVNRFGVFPTSVNGLANNPGDYTFWIVDIGGEERSSLLTLTEVEPEDGGVIILTYVDLSAWSDHIDLVTAELPADIEAGQATATFTLYVINDITKEYTGYNVTILEGEALVDGLLRAWKDENSDFSFSGDFFELFGKRGFYPVAVNYLANREAEHKSWFVMDESFDLYSCDKIQPEDFSPISLFEYKPVDGGVVKLVYLEGETLVDHGAGDGELPGRIRREDESFTLPILISNEVTQEFSQHNVTIKYHENLLEALLRAWKAPESDVNFGFSKVGFFNVVGYFLTSVNGVNNDPENFQFWVVVDPTEENGRGLGQMANGGQLTKPIGLEEYIPRPGFPVVLAFKDFSAFSADMDFLGNSRKELPKDIEAGDQTINFNLLIYNDITQMGQKYNLTIIDGETLLEAFVRAWKNPELDFNFLALPMEFFGTFGIFIKGINGIANCEDNLYFWFVKRMNGRDDDPINNPVSLTEFNPVDGEDVHVVFNDFSPYREDIEYLLRHLRNRERGRFTGYYREEEEEEDDEEEEEEMGYLPFVIEDDSESLNFSLIVFNNLTNEYVRFNLTILEGENLLHAMYRAWKNPDIDFSFGAARFTLFGKFGMYPVSVNGLANDHQAFNFWLVEKYQSSTDEMTGDNGPLGLIDAVPYAGETYTLVYADLSAYKDDLVPSELPADIDVETDQTLTFTLYIVNNVTEKHCGFNLTVIEGENLLEGLKRAWKDPEINFNFQVEVFSLVGYYGAFLTSVNDVRNDMEDLYVWLVVQDEESQGIENIPSWGGHQPLGVTDVVPMAGYNIFLIYKDLSPYSDLFGEDEEEVHMYQGNRQG